MVLHPRIHEERVGECVGLLNSWNVTVFNTNRNRGVSGRINSACRGVTVNLNVLPMQYSVRTRLGETYLPAS
jgi:hypothetical protein